MLRLLVVEVPPGGKAVRLPIVTSTPDYCPNAGRRQVGCPARRAGASYPRQQPYLSV